MIKRTALHIALCAALAAPATVASIAFAAPPVLGVGAAPVDRPPPTAPGHNKLQCFDGTTDEASEDDGGTCRIVGRGAMGPAILDLTEDGFDTSFAGVRYAESNLYGTALGDVRHLRFHYVADDEELVAGNLVLILPIDADGTGASFEDAIIDVAVCPGTDGVVNVIADDECVIDFAGGTYDNWAALVEAFPDAIIADAEDASALIVATRGADDNAASYRVSAVMIGKPGHKPGKP
jgi:hypothetical protein